MQLTLSARAENVVVVRQVVGAVAEAVGMPHRVREDVRLAVTEACTNVVRHAYEKEGPMTVSLHHARDGLRVEVSDRGRGIAPHPAGGGAGLGLPLIAALADRVDVQHAPDRGSRIAMCFARTASASASGSASVSAEPLGGVR